MRIRGQRDVLEEFGRRIVRLREAKGWSRAELARRVGVTRERLGHWERGVSTLPLENLIALRRELGVSVDELVAGEPAPAGGLSREQKDNAISHLATVIKLLR
jgi:transcriptional regulator with XRE-family HTH domain